jgi:malonate transporter and related proteins
MGNVFKASMTKILTDALVPIFAGFLLGYFAWLWGVIDNQNVRTLITFVRSFAIPCLLFLAVASTPLAASRQQATTALVLTMVYVALYAESFYWVRSRENLPPADSSVVALTLGLPSSAAVGLPLLASVFGSRSTVTVSTALAIGSVTVSPMILAILEASRSGEGFALKHIGPIVWAPAAGVLFCRLESSFFHESISRCEGISG